MIDLYDADATKLLIICRRFPYNHGEVPAEIYLESEVGYLAKRFDEILLVGTEAPVGAVPTIELPGNVKSVSLGCGCSKAYKFMYALEGLGRSVIKPMWSKQAYETDPVSTIGEFAFRGYCDARAHRKYLALVDRLYAMNFRPTHVYSFWLNDAALIACWIKRAFSCRCAISRAHRFDLYKEANDFNYQPFRNYLMMNLDYVLPCSEHGRFYLSNTWPDVTCKVETLYLGTSEVPDRSAEEADNILHVVSCSRVECVKRLDLLAQAMSLLDGKSVRAVWTHFGDGSNLEEVKRMCKGFTSVEADFPGYVDNRELMEAYTDCHADVFVNVSESEGLPLSIMEACGYGFPIVATDVGGTSELVRNGVNGVLLGANPSAEAVASAIERIALQSPEERLSMRIASRNAWETGFRTQANVDRLIEVILDSDRDVA